MTRERRFAHRIGPAVFAAVAAAAAQCAIDASAQMLSVGQVSFAEYPTVRVNVSVTDRKHRPVTGLGAAVFEVEHDGRRIRVLGAEPHRRGRDLTAVVLAIDRSGSMRGGPLRQAIAASDSFIAGMAPGDLVGVVAFDDRVSVIAAPDRDRERVRAALRTLTVGRDTALNDGAVEAVRLLTPYRGARRFVIILTDGKENRSHSTLDTAVEVARRENVAIHSVAMGQQVDRRALRRLAGETGGRAFEAPTPGDLVRLFGQIDGLLKNEYVLTLSLDVVPDAHWHQLSVVTTVDGVKVAGRRDYLAIVEPVVASVRLAPGPRRSHKSGHVAVVSAAVIIGLAALGCIAAFLLWGRRPKTL